MSFLANALRRLVLLLVGMARFSLLTMRPVPCVDVALRKLGHPPPGTYDIVKLAAAVTLACGLPYTTAVRGHVAPEFFWALH